MSCEKHEWDNATSPREQKCQACGILRPTVENINEGEIGKLYWNSEWAKRGLQENIYPKTFALILSQIKPTDKVIDIGCGTGSFANEFRKKFPVEQFDKHTISGMDISEVAIRTATEKVLEFYGYVGQFPEDLPQHLLRAFDVAVCTEFLEHTTDDENACLYLSRLLKDRESVLFVSVPDDFLPPSSELEHQRTYTTEGLDNLLCKLFDTVHIIRIKEEQKLMAYCTQRIDTARNGIVYGD